MNSISICFTGAHPARERRAYCKFAHAAENTLYINAGEPAISANKPVGSARRHRLRHIIYPTDFSENEGTQATHSQFWRLSLAHTALHSPNFFRPQGPNLGPLLLLIGLKRGLWPTWQQRPQRQGSASNRESRPPQEVTPGGPKPPGNAAFGGSGA